MKEKPSGFFHPVNVGSLTHFYTLFAGLFLVGLATVIPITLILPKTYASTARIKVLKEQPESAQAGSEIVIVPYDPDFFQAQCKIIQSQSVLTNVVNSLNLNAEWGRKLFDGEPLKTTETISILKARMKVMPVNNTSLISITVYDENKDAAARLANTIARCFHDYRQKIVRETESRHWEKIQLQSKELADEIASDRLQETSPASANPTNRLGQLMEQQKLVSAKIESVKIKMLIPDSEFAPIQVIDYAEPGKFPVKPSMIENIAATGVVAAILAGIIVLGLSFFSRRNA